jgi:hypothetical protein
MKQFSPLKQAAIGALVKPLVAHAATRSETNPTIPSASDFMECSSGADLLDLVGDGGEPIDSLEKIPQSFWLHPQLVAVYVTHRHTKIESIGDAVVLAIEGMDNDSATKLAEQYYKFLVFIWGVGNGHARTLTKLVDPPYDDKTDSLLEKPKRSSKRATTKRIATTTCETGKTTRTMTTSPPEAKGEGARAATPVAVNGDATNEGPARGEDVPAREPDPDPGAGAAQKPDHAPGRHKTGDVTVGPGTGGGQPARAEAAVSTIGTSYVS